MDTHIGRNFNSTCQASIIKCFRMSYLFNIILFYIVASPFSPPGKSRKGHTTPSSTRANGDGTPKRGGKRGLVGGQKLHFGPGTKAPATSTTKGMKSPSSKTSSKGSRVTIHTESKSMFL